MVFLCYLAYLNLLVFLFLTSRLVGKLFELCELRYQLHRVGGIVIVWLLVLMSLLKMLVGLPSVMSEGALVYVSFIRCRLWDFLCFLKLLLQILYVCWRMCA